MDAIGSITEVITKGIKFATTMLAVRALCGELRTTVPAGLGGAADVFGLSVTQPSVLVGSSPARPWSSCPPAC